jgi:DNA-binding NarL/FixJ family response regulator
VDGVNAPPTPRELEILERVTRPGADRDRVARDLGISTATVKAHLRQLYAKLGVSSEAQAWRRLHGPE